MKSMVQWIAVVVGMMSLVMLAGPGCQDDGGATGSTSRAVECADDGTCPGEAVCVRGYCMPDCVTDSDCPDGVCVAGVCEFEPEPWACAADSDCPAGTSCVAGSCVADPATCTPAAEVCNGLDDDCDGVVDDGCSCAPGEAMCGTACVDLLFDGLNCGACANACAAGQTCLRGVCTGSVVCASAADCDDGDPATGDICLDGFCRHEPTCVPSIEICNGLDDDCDGMVDEEGCGCAAGETLCGSVCVDLLFDNLHCGACGSACPAGQTCTRGVCTA